MLRPLLRIVFVLVATSLSPTVLASGSDLAHGQPATASSTHGSSLPDSAFDGDTATSWNSGDYAPQWIEVDLGADYPVTEVDGLADITPNGQVTHAVEGRTSSGTTYPLGGFSGFSARSEWVRIACDRTQSVRYVRVTTTSSPSWIAWFEIRVLSETPVSTAHVSWGALKARFR